MIYEHDIVLFCKLIQMIAQFECNNERAYTACSTKETFEVEPIFLEKKIIRRKKYFDEDVNVKDEVTQSAQ